MGAGEEARAVQASSWELNLFAKCKLCLNAESAASRAQAYFILDEMLLAGELQEPSKKVGVPVGGSAGRCLLAPSLPAREAWQACGGWA